MIKRLLNLVVHTLAFLGVFLILIGLGMSIQEIM